MDTRIDDILCLQEERTVGRDNCVRYQCKILQIRADQYSCHYVKAKVRVHKYPNGHYAVFHGPRKLADYDRQGQIIITKAKQAAAQKKSGQFMCYKNRTILFASNIHVNQVASILYARYNERFFYTFIVDQVSH